MFAEDQEITRTWVERRTQRMTWNVLCAQGMVASGPTMVTRYPIPRIGITIIRACKLDSLILNRMKKRKKRDIKNRAVIFYHFTLTQYCKLSCESEMPRHDTTQKKITLAHTQNDIVQ